MKRVTRLTSAIATLALTTACAAVTGPPANSKAPSAPRPLHRLSVTERGVLLDRAEIWQPIDTAHADLLRGPGGRGTIGFDENVTCTFHFPDEPLTGVTPKFECDIAPGDTVKVKYGEDNGEVFAEVAATRLFWALGFVVDRMYPAKVTCVGCPLDPHRASTTDWSIGRPGQVRTIVFDPAIIERKVEGVAIEVPDFEGWAWNELETINVDNVGATRAHRDALKLLAVFIQHVDSKPRQQALVCRSGDVAYDTAGNATCERPLLMVKDLGSSFAAAKTMSFPKMKLESWRSVPIWKDAKGCRGNLTRSIVGTLEHPVISEEGRMFLLERLDQLSDRQLLDLFTAARVDRRGEELQGRGVTAEDWVQVFKHKREQIRARHCA